MLPELSLQPFPLRPPGQAKPELTSKVGTPGLYNIKPNKSFNYLCDHCCRRHLCLIKALVTFKSGVLLHCVLIWLCSVSLRELNFYPMNKFQAPSVPSRGCLIYKASLVKCCVSLFEVGSQEAWLNWLFSCVLPFSVNPSSIYSVFPALFPLVRGWWF